MVTRTRLSVTLHVHCFSCYLFTSLAALPFFPPLLSVFLHVLVLILLHPYTFRYFLCDFAYLIDAGVNLLLVAATAGIVAKLIAL
jgi:hypothetical protein